MSGRIVLVTQGDFAEYVGDGSGVVRETAEEQAVDGGSELAEETGASAPAVEDYGVG